MEYTLLAFQDMIKSTRKDKIVHSELDFRPVRIITDHMIYNSPYKYWPAERGPNDLKRHWWILVKLWEEAVQIWIFVSVAKQNISNWLRTKEPCWKASAVFLNFLFIFLSSFLTFLSSSKTAQKFKRSQHLAGATLRASSF